MPNQTIDPIIIASQIITLLQTIISRNINPVEKALISITKIHGGSAYNVIDDEVILGGTVRTFKNETRENIEKKIINISKGIAKANGGDAEIQYTRKYPPTINSKEKSIFAGNVAKELVGEENVITDIEPSMGGEDFSYLLNEKPGSYLYIGQKDNYQPRSLLCNGEQLELPANFSTFWYLELAALDDLNRLLWLVAWRLVHGRRLASQGGLVHIAVTRHDDPVER